MNQEKYYFTFTKILVFSIIKRINLKYKKNKISYRKSFNDSFYYLEKCIELNDKLFGYTNKKKANLFILLGKISSNIKQFPQAYIYYQKANSLFERLEGINNMTSIDCLLKMAQIKHELKEYILAFELYEKVLQMYIAKIGNNHFFVYVVYLNLIYLSHLLKYEDKKEFYYSELIYHCCNKVKLNFCSLKNYN